MRNIKEDRRAKYTKMVLKDSLLELLKTKPIEKITVSELAKKADINRATLYIHYYDAFDLLEKIEDEFFNSIIQSMEILKTGDSVSILETVLNAIYENKKLCEVLFGQFGDMKFLEKIMDSCGNKIKDFWQNKSQDIGNPTLELINCFSIGGNASLIKCWIKNNFNISIKQLLNLMVNLNAKGVDYFIKL